MSTLKGGSGRYLPGDAYGYEVGEGWGTSAKGDVSYPPYMKDARGVPQTQTYSTYPSNGSAITGLSLLVRCLGDAPHWGVLVEIDGGRQYALVQVDSISCPPWVHTTTSKHEAAMYMFGKAHYPVHLREHWRPIRPMTWAQGLGSFCNTVWRYQVLGRIASIFSMGAVCGSCITASLTILSKLGGRPRALPEVAEILAVEAKPTRELFRPRRRAR
jgi:hypothetical protein